MNKSKIEWCDYTWNPVTGCLHACEYCYARRIANRFSTHGNKLTGSIHVVDNPMCGYKAHEPINSSDVRHDPYPYCFEPTFHRYRLDEPAKLNKPSRIFVVSMGDLFGDWVPDEWIMEVMKTVKACPQHTFMFLTKNPNKYRQLLDTYGRFFFPVNAHFGATADTRHRFETATIAFQKLKYEDRMEGFREMKTFISAEPLLENILGNNPDWITWIDWMIIGAQTGPGAKPTNSEWVQSIIDQCRTARIPIFLKDNLNWPERIQEFPEFI
jgi:protein gp37